MKLVALYKLTWKVRKGSFTRKYSIYKNDNVVVICIFSTSFMLESIEKPLECKSKSWQWLWRQDWMGMKMFPVIKGGGEEKIVK